MGFVESVLQAAAALRFVHGAAHGVGNGIGIEDHQALGISRGAADGLNQTGLTAEEALLIRIEDRHQRHLGQVETFTQEVNTHQHIELTKAQVADDLHTLQGRHIRVHIPHADTALTEMGGQVLCHPLGEGGHQHTLVALGASLNFGGQIFDLSLHAADFHAGIEKSRGADDLLHQIIGAAALILTGGGGDVDGLSHALIKLLKFQRAVIKGAGQTETVAHQALLTGAVAVIHGADLGQGHMALVHQQQEVIGEEVKERHGGRAHRAVADDAGVVLNTRAIAQGLHHLHVVFRTLTEALCLHQHVVFFKIGKALRQFLLNDFNGGIHLVLGGHIVAGGIHRHMV